jgi:hypothetical protein
LEGTVELPTEIVYDTVYADRVVIQHDSVLVYIHDTVVINNDVYHTDTLVVHDTVVVNGDTVVKTDTIYMTRELSFDCYTFNSEGNIIAKTDEKDYYITFNVLIENSGDVYFQKESDAPFVLENTEAYFDYGNCTFFTVTKGEEEVTLEVLVKGANNIVINNQDVHPCTPFHVEADLTELPDEEIKGVTYEVAVIRYSLINGDDEVVETSRQYLYAPIAEPKNERTVKIDYTLEKAHEFDGAWLIVTGLIDNSILPDSSSNVRIPLTLDLSTEDLKTVYGENFDFTLGKNLVEGSKDPSDKEMNNNGLVVSYKEYNGLYHHTSTASGNNVTTEQKVSYYNDFVVTYGGEVKNIEFPLSVKAKSFTKGEVEVEGSTAKVRVNIEYEATIANLTATASQDIDVVINAIAFDNQKVLYANRTITFSGLQSPRVYDCVITEVNNNGAHNFVYREIVNGQPQGWEFVSLSDENFSFITEGLRKSGSALAIHFHKNVTGPQVGYLLDRLESDKQVLYYSQGNPHTTLDNVTFAMFGELETPILGQGSAKGSLIEVECKAGVYNKKEISPAQTLLYVAK